MTRVYRGSGRTREEVQGSMRPEKPIGRRVWLLLALFWIALIAAAIWRLG